MTRLQITGYAKLDTLGTTQLGFLTRTGRFTEAVPGYARLMRLTERIEGKDYLRHTLIGGRAVPVTGAAREQVLSPNAVRDLFSRYIDENIGSRVTRPEASAMGFDPQHLKYFERIQLQNDTVINGEVVTAGRSVAVERELQLPTCHQALLPTGWDLAKEMGIAPEKFKIRSRAHLIALRLLVEGLVMMGAPWKTIAQAIPAERIKVYVASSFSPGDVTEWAMAKMYFGEALERGELAFCLSDYLSFAMARVLRARRSSTRVAACCSGIAAMEDLTRDMERSDGPLLGVIINPEAGVNRTSVSGFDGLGAAATDAHVARTKKHPSFISCPGEKERYGITLAEGGGLLMVMREDYAQQLGLNNYGQLIAASTALGAETYLDPGAATQGLALVLEEVLAEAANHENLIAAQLAGLVDFIMAHGTSTQADGLPIAIYEKYFQAMGRDPRHPALINYNKGGPRFGRNVGTNGIGHTWAAANTIAAVEALQIFATGIMPPAVSALDQLDPILANTRHLLYPTQALRGNFQYALVEGMAYGDVNGLALLKRAAQASPTAASAWTQTQLALIEDGMATWAQYLP